MVTLVTTAGKLDGGLKMVIKANRSYKCPGCSEKLTTTDKAPFRCAKCQGQYQARTSTTVIIDGTLWEQIVTNGQTWFMAFINGKYESKDNLIDDDGVPINPLTGSIIENKTVKLSTGFRDYGTTNKLIDDGAHSRFLGDPTT